MVHRAARAEHQPEGAVDGGGGGREGQGERLHPGAREEDGAARVAVRKEGERRRREPRRKHPDEDGETDAGRAILRIGIEGEENRECPACRETPQESRTAVA